MFGHGYYGGGYWGGGFFGPAAGQVFDWDGLTSQTATMPCYALTATEAWRAMTASESTRGVTMELISITEGWTDTLGPFTLRVDGTPLVLTGYTVALVLRDEAGALITHGGTTTVLNQSTYPGQVTYKPVAADFTFSPDADRRQSYWIKWKVTDGAGSIAYFPQGEADTISVYRG